LTTDYSNGITVTIKACQVRFKRKNHKTGCVNSLTLGEEAMNKAVLALLLLTLTGCGKLGVSGTVGKAFGDWAEVKLPSGCVAKQISAEEQGGVAVLCEDGRVFN
jgi:hypothetical protein